MVSFIRFQEISGLFQRVERVFNAILGIVSFFKNISEVFREEASYGIWSMKDA